MQFQRLLAIALVADQCNLVDASYPDIAGYAPGSQVTDHNAIDLDQKAIEEALGMPTIDYTLVKNIYEQGGNSKSYAEFTIPGLAAAVNKGGSVTGATSNIAGRAYSNYASGTTTFRAAYPVSDNQATYVSCKAGALPAAPSGTTATAMTPYIFSGACYAQGESLSVVQADSTAASITPTAGPTNKAGRTLRGFSTAALARMYTVGSGGGCSGASDRATDGCPYFDFMMYYNYYGDGDYANKFVLAAINGGSTSFTDVSGNMDFTGTVDKLRKECIKKGTAYMNAYMYAIREFEDAIDDCLAGCPGGASDTVSGMDCNDLSTDAVHAWDEGVAFYTGSLEGPNVGGDSAGKLSYRLAEKRCANFMTCGANGDSTSGVSYVNTMLIQHMNTGKGYLLAGQCEQTRPLLQNMVALMAIPLIQGTLRYAYIVDREQGDDKAKGEGAVFAAAIVPRVNYCSSADATTIMNNMKVGASSTLFAAVKTAFENNYACMNITCAQVGGLVDSTGAYKTDADPCGFESSNAPRTGALSVAMITVLVTMLFSVRGQ